MCGPGDGLPVDSDAAADRPPSRAPQGPRGAAPSEDNSKPLPGYIAVARILRPHGLGGELRVQAFSSSALNLAPGRWVTIAGIRRRVLERREGKGALLLRLSGLFRRQEVEQFRGLLIQVPDDEAERDDPDSYFIHELLGLDAVTPEGDSLGRITEVLQPGGADVYVVAGPRGELLVPAIADVVRLIDLRSHQIVIDPMPGL